MCFQLSPCYIHLTRFLSPCAWKNRPRVMHDSSFYFFHISSRALAQDDKLQELRNRQSELRKAREGKKDEDVPQAEKDEMKDIDGKISETENAISGIYTEYAKDNKIVHELIDLALLQNGMLKGESLAAFIRRSVDLI